jgi:hypothetical protein
VPPLPHLPLQRISSSAAELPVSSGVRRVLPQSCSTLHHDDAEPPHSCSTLHPDDAELLQGTTTGGWSSGGSRSSSPHPPSLSTSDRGRRAHDLGGGAHLQEKRTELQRRTSSPLSSVLPPSSPLCFSLFLCLSYLSDGGGSVSGEHDGAAPPVVGGARTTTATSSWLRLPFSPPSWREAIGRRLHRGTWWGQCR